MAIGMQLRGERAITFFLVALCLLSYARIYMLRDVYADDNCWLLGIHLGYDLPAFLATGFTEMRREALGVFLYVFLLPFRYLENPYIVWHTIILATQVATVLVLYKFVERLFEDQWLAAFVAGALVIVPLDFTTPYLSGFNYRVALLLCLLSLYLSDSAARRPSWGWRWTAAVALALWSAYMFHEATIGFEPVRFVLLWARFHRTGQPVPVTLRTIGRFWAPFLLLMSPLVAYKLLFRPFGIYGGMYSSGLSHFFSREDIENAFSVFKLGQWRLLRYLRSYAGWDTLALAFVGGLTMLFFLSRMRRESSALDGRAERTHWWLLGIFAVTLLSAQLFIFFFAGRPPKLGFDATHAALLQPAYAIVTGGAAYAVVRRLARFGAWRFWASGALLALMCAVGTYFNNLNLDMYAQASSQQRDFWKAFRSRFPALPERADFLIDARPRPYNRRIESFYEWEDLHANYDLELPLNRMYAPAVKGERRYRVYSPEEFSSDLKRHGQALGREGIGRQTHFGTETLDARGMTVVFYRNGRLLVNREIVEEYPASAYRLLADKPLPPWATQRN
jgi:hypothetical protein